MLVVSGIPIEVGEPTTFQGVDGDVTTHRMTLVHSAEEAAKDRPFGEFFQVPPKFVAPFQAALESGKMVTFLCREQALPGGKSGHWIKRVVSDVAR